MKKLNRPLASISLDLDNQWSYMKIHGDEGWEDFPSYLDRFVPYVLDVLEELKLSITFFIVGQDAALEKNREFLKMISFAQHEVGNHSFHHESWLHKYSKDRLAEEIDIAEKYIIDATGMKPVGFRGPGFSWNGDLLRVLKDRGYQYDASTLPTWIGPIARAYYFKTAQLTGEQKAERGDLFGNWNDVLRSNRPYQWAFNGSSEFLLEIPVTVMPLFRIPFHLSYLLYLSGFSIGLMRKYLHSAIYLCRIQRVQPSFLLHPLDLIGGDQMSDLAFFPGMNISSDFKIKVFKEVITILEKHYQLVPMQEHAQWLKSQKNIRIKNLVK